MPGSRRGPFGGDPSPRLLDRAGTVVAEEAAAETGGAGLCLAPPLARRPGRGLAG